MTMFLYRIEAVWKEKVGTSEEPAPCQNTCELPWHSLWLALPWELVTL